MTERSSQNKNYFLSLGFHAQAIKPGSDREDRSKNQKTAREQRGVVAGILQRYWYTPRTD